MHSKEGAAVTRADEIRDLYAFNRWANDRILGAAGALTEEQLRRDLGSSFPSVLGTLAHVLSSEWVWLRRLRGESPAGLPPAWDLSSLDAVRARWAEVERERDALLAALDDDDLARTLPYRTTAGTPRTNRMDEMLRHVVNHSSYHRGQVTTMLRQLGAATVVTDLIAFHWDPQ